MWFLRTAPFTAAREEPRTTHLSFLSECQSLLSSFLKGWPIDLGKILARNIYILANLYLDALWSSWDYPRLPQNWVPGPFIYESVSLSKSWTSVHLSGITWSKQNGRKLGRHTLWSRCMCPLCSGWDPVSVRWSLPALSPLSLTEAPWTVSLPNFTETWRE